MRSVKRGRELRSAPDRPEGSGPAYPAARGKTVAGAMSMKARIASAIAG